MGSLLAEAQTSDSSQMGEEEEDVKDELELGNLECPRKEKVGVGGAELSDAIQYGPDDWREASGLAVTSSVEVAPAVLVANLSGSGLRILKAAGVVEICSGLPGSHYYLKEHDLIRRPECC